MHGATMRFIPIRSSRAERDVQQASSSTKKNITLFAPALNEKIMCGRINEGKEK